MKKKIDVKNLSTEYFKSLLKHGNDHHFLPDHLRSEVILYNQNTDLFKSAKRHCSNLYLIS